MRHYLQTQKLDRIPLQDKLALRGRIVKLVENIARVLDVPGCKNIRAHHDAVLPDHGDQELERLRIVDQIIVVKPPQVLTERSRQWHMLVREVREEVLDPSREIREGASRVWQNHFQLRIFVQNP